MAGEAGFWGRAMRTVAALLLICLASCASTTSSMVIPQSTSAPQVAVLPLDGPLGVQAADLISAELASHGVATVERANVDPVLGVETDLSPGTPTVAQNYAHYGQALRVRYLFVGTISADQGPLASYAHVVITLRLIDVTSGQTRWIGRYGNSAWSSALSTQGDLRRGSQQMVQEFVRAGGPAILAQ